MAIQEPVHGIRDAYATGRGIFRTRATVKIEQVNARRTGIVVTELPYNIGPEKVITRITDLVQAKEPRRIRLSRICGHSGAAASRVTGGSISSRALAFLAAVAAATAPILGREILSVDSEARWIRARATAEAIKSECFRFAAQLGDYAGSSARAAFIARRNTLSEQAERAGLTPLPDPVPSSGDARRPPSPLTMPWYIEHRLNEQMRYYANGQTENEEGVRRFRVAGFAATKHSGGGPLRQASLA